MAEPKKGIRGPDKKPRSNSRHTGRPADGETIRGKGVIAARRARVVDLVVLGKSTEEIATELGVGQRTIQRDLEDKGVAGEISARLTSICDEAERYMRGQAGNVARSLVKAATDGGQFDGPKVKAAGEVLDRIGLVKKQPVEVRVTGALEVKSIGELEAMVRRTAAKLEGKTGTEDDEE